MPFRLSDTQVVVFIASMVLVGLIHLLSMVRVFTQFAAPEVGTGALLAFSSVSCIIVSAFFLSRKNKEDSIELRHLDHREVEMTDEYATIL
jgi:ACR3 family arsenite efflux pump ArsB